MRTRSGQGSRNDDQCPNRGPPIQIRRGQAEEEGNSRGDANPPPLTLQDIQKLLDDSRLQTQADMNRLLEERLGEGSKSLSEKSVKSKTPENITQTQSSSREAPRLPPRKMAKEDLKVEFASQMLKANALTWWSTLDRTLGSEVVSSFTWEEFTKRLRGKFCSARHREKLVDEFFALSKEKQSVDEYTKKFCDMLPFLEDTLLTEAGRINRYANRLPSDYALEVGKASTLDEAIEATARVESMLEKRAKERQSFGENRKQSGHSGSSKKSRFSSGSSKREEVKECKRCGKHHSGECLKTHGRWNVFLVMKRGTIALNARRKEMRLWSPLLVTRRLDQRK
ncbi:hypothetical protein L2E82_11121 [Cichorium intybus]|uniref:Uncharacterized protein n=1 Tax=Cichorium intybus TaxID=13427 RepID=A0ACB9GDE8_CICIN|nr:hypothetical protein L2E82_11121 [Cichorium intybus]